MAVAGIYAGNSPYNEERLTDRISFYYTKQEIYLNSHLLRMRRFTQYCLRSSAVLEHD